MATLFALASCRGELSVPVGPNQGAFASSAAPDDGAAPNPDDETAHCDASPLDARLLSTSELRHTVTDLLGLSAAQVSEMEGFDGPVLDSVAIDELTAERIARSAEQLSAIAVEHLDALSLCAWPAGEGAQPGKTGVSCAASELVESVGSRAYRRPLTHDERAALQALYDAGLAEGSTRDAVEWLLTGVFSAPDFLYRLAVPSGDEPSPSETMPLAPFELASRLSYFLWHSMPDQPLYEAAESGALLDGDALRVEVERLLAHPHFTRSLHAYYAHWLSLSRFGEVARDDAALTPEVIASLQRSVMVGVEALYAEGAPNVTTLLSGTTYYLDDVLASFYGATESGSGFGPVNLAHQGRHGLLNHPAFLTVYARPGETDPIGRGVFMLRNLFCTELHAPEDVEIPPLPPLEEGLSVRERLEAHTENVVCNACHGLIDPLGLSLEKFDEVGRVRHQDGGKAVDSSGDVQLGSDLDGPFARGELLFAKLGDSADVRACFAKRFYRYALAREITANDGCALASIERAFVEKGDLRALLVDIALSPAFRERRLEGSP